MSNRLGSRIGLGSPKSLNGGLAVILAMTVGFGISRAASPDNTIEWDGVHHDPSFRTPLQPAQGQNFTVDLRVFRGDITGANVRTYDGTVQRYPMFWVRNEGDSNQYDRWRALIPGTQSAALYYRFEITDGTDTDYFNRLGMSGEEPGSGDFLINTTPLGRFSLGATIESNSVIFRVWAPNASAAFVAGDFNGWSSTTHPMTNVAGFWQIRVPGAAHGQQYKYLFENSGTHWRTDPRGRAQTSSVGNSIIWDPNRYRWADTNWVAPYFEDMIVYELHVGTFAGEADGVGGHPARFRDVVDYHCDHLVELGINVVELMPINEFAGDLSWGYNPAFQYSPESAYGSPEDLKYLVDRCHQAGLAVILDVVYNHMGASDLAGNILEYDGSEILFYPVGNGYRDTPWGPRPDYGIAPVRDYLTETIPYWLSEYHLDGFRVDGTAFVKVNTDGWRLLRDLAHAADTVSRKALVSAEQLPNDAAVTEPIDRGGAGLDSQWNDLFHDHLREALNAAAFGDPDMARLVEGMNHFAFGGVKAINYIESHDEAAVQGRVTTAADSANPHSVWAYGRGKLCYGLVMFTAGMPFILQGQEFMEDRRFGDALENRIQWNYKTLYADYFRACRDMTWLRRRSTALRADSHQNIYHVNDSGNVVAWHRWSAGGDDLVIVASFNNNDFDTYCVGMPLNGTWLELLNSDAALYGGQNHGNAGQITANGPGMHGLPYSACITLPRMGLLVFGKQPVDLTPDLDADNDNLPDAWERQYGCDPNNPADASADDDHDGANTFEEYQAGTDPRLAASVFRVRIAQGSGTVFVRWDSVLGRTYRVESAPVPTPAQWTPVATHGGTGGELSLTNTISATSPDWFYRIHVAID